MNPITNSTSPAFSRWSPAAWLRISGADAGPFLQGQFTNDLRGSHLAGVYGLWLTLKGKLMGDGFVWRAEGANEFWIASYATEAGALRERLEAFVIADDVVIEDCTVKVHAVSIVGDVGPETEGRLGAFGPFFRGRRTLPANWELIFPVEQEAAVLAALAGVPELEKAEIERRRILAGVPAVPGDLGSGDLPNEGGLESVAISYTKGCYLGQEVMARLKSMGTVRRRLLRVRGTGGPLPQSQTPLWLGTRQVGELRTVAADGSGGFVAWAMVSLVHVTAGAELRLGTEEGAAVSLIDQP